MDWIWEKLIPDPGSSGKKAPDPGFGSATVPVSDIIRQICFFPSRMTTRRMLSSFSMPTATKFAVSSKPDRIYNLQD